MNVLLTIKHIRNKIKVKNRYDVTEATLKKKIVEKSTNPKGIK